MRIGTNKVVAIGTLCLVAVMVAALAQQEFSWWALPFSLLFGTVFAGVLALCVLNYREDRFRRARIGDHPNEPWMWDERWQTDIMISRSKSEFWGTLAFSIILGVFATVGIASLIQGLASGNPWVLLNIIAIGAAAWFGRTTYLAWQNRRLEGHVQLANETRPAWVGDRVSVVMKMPPGDQDERIETWLEHFKVIRREDSDGVSFEKVVDRKVKGAVERSGDGKFRLTAELPENSSPTSWSDDEQRRWWDLVVAMHISGRQVTLRYEIPVADPNKHEITGALTG